MRNHCLITKSYFMTLFLTKPLKLTLYLLSQELTFSTDIGTHNLRARVNLVPLLGPLSYICE
jgi:hypothetical protein